MNEARDRIVLCKNVQPGGMSNDIFEAPFYRGRRIPPERGGVGFALYSGWYGVLRASAC
jgi:hypothetical protein